MATMTNPIELHELANHFVVIHPLDDVLEEKVDTENLGPMTMTASVRISLLGPVAQALVPAASALSPTPVLPQAAEASSGDSTKHAGVLSLRVHLVLMMILVFYDVLDLAGLFGHYA